MFFGIGITVLAFMMQEVSKNEKFGNKNIAVFANDNKHWLLKKTAKNLENTQIHCNYVGLQYISNVVICYVDFQCFIKIENICKIFCN